MTKAIHDASSGTAPLRFVTSAAALRANDGPALSALAILAHDFRSPLASLAVLADAMHSAGRSQDLYRLGVCSERAHKLIEHLNGVLESVLHRTWVSGDPLQIDPRLIELGGVLEAALELNRPVAEHRSISLARGGLPAIAVIGDRRLLIEAVDNLLNNAIKHTEDGTRIECTLVQQGRCAVVRISDRGNGLTEAQIKRLFHPFARAPTDHDARAAPGVGLWITRLIAERHGGHIEAASRGVKLGAVFELHLPDGSSSAGVTGECGTVSCRDFGLNGGRAKAKAHCLHGNCSDVSGDTGGVHEAPAGSSAYQHQGERS